MEGCAHLCEAQHCDSMAAQAVQRALEGIIGFGQAGTTSCCGGGERTGSDYVVDESNVGFTANRGGVGEARD